MKTSCYRHKPRAYLVYLTTPSPEKGLLLATNLKEDHSNSYNNLRHPAGDFSPTSLTSTFYTVTPNFLEGLTLAL